ncbi:MAG: fimbrial protein [Prevotella sp.]|jgi:hypothetical protein|nr:fimbrial protein [Prevotella sp.]
MMKLRYLSGVILSAGLTAFLSSCMTDDVETAVGHGLTMEVSIANTQVSSSTRAADGTASDGTLNEDQLKTLDVYIFNQDGTSRLFYGHYDAVTPGNKVTLDSDPSWRNLFSSSSLYQVYALANYTGSGLSGINTVADLKALSQTDDDIYKLYAAGSAVGSSEYTPNKTFLMDGERTWTPSTSIGDEETVDISLKRAASKVKVFLNMTSDLSQAYTLQPNACTWKFVNYTDNTSAIDGGNKVVPEEKTTEMLHSGQFKANETDLITTYTYSNNWDSQLVDGVPYILVNMPVKDNTSGKVLSGNYYRIPLVSANVLKMDRNYIYKVNASIGTLGSSTEQTDKDFGPVNYSVIPWTVDDIDVNADKINYLTVSPTNVIMQNTTEDTKVHYYSSSDISIKIDEVYYYDKLGKKQAISPGNSISVTPSADLRNGMVKIASTLPVNKGIRYIKFTISNAEGKSQQVYVKQYPLEYIQFINGWYSTRTTAGWVDWQRDQTPHWPEKTCNDSHFEAKVYDNGIYPITESSSWGGYTAQKGWWYGNLDNRCMYVIEVTSTSNTYTISHPKIDDNGLSQDNVVSPAFMIASQLGAVTTFGNNGNKAAIHCRTYREVDTSGKKYDGWRLPTLNELNIIKEYQTGTNTVMSIVLGGRNYFAADGQAHLIYPQGDNGNFVRCVRDLTPEEIGALDADKK